MASGQTVYKQAKKIYKVIVKYLFRKIQENAIKKSCLEFKNVPNTKYIKKIMFL